VCVCESVVLVIRYGKRSRRTIRLSEICAALQNFPIYLAKGTIFGKNAIGYKMCITTCNWNLSHSKNNSARYYQNVSRSS